MLGSFRNQAIDYASKRVTSPAIHERERLEFLQQNIQGCLSPATGSSNLPVPITPTSTFISADHNRTLSASQSSRSGRRQRVHKSTTKASSAKSGRDHELEAALVAVQGDEEISQVISPLVSGPSESRQSRNQGITRPPPLTLANSVSENSRTPTRGSVSSSPFNAGSIAAAVPLGQGSGTPRSGRWWVGEFHPDSARSLPLPERNGDFLEDSSYANDIDVFPTPRSHRSERKKSKLKGKGNHNPQSASVKTKRTKPRHFYDKRVPTDLNEGIETLIEVIEGRISDMKVKEEEKLKQSMPISGPENVNQNSDKASAARYPSPRMKEKEKEKPAASTPSTPMKFADREKLFTKSKYYCPMPRRSRVQSRKTMAPENGQEGKTPKRREIHVARVNTGKDDAVIDSCEAFLDELVAKERGITAKKAKIELDRIRRPVRKWYEMRGKEFTAELIRSAHAPMPQYQSYLESLVEYE